MGKRITSLTEITTVTENDYIPVDNAATGARKLSADFINDLEDEIDGKQDALTAGANISITQDGTISATDTTYTAGTNVDITNGVISATDTTYTAGTNITITNGEISATDTDTLSGLTDTGISSPSDGDALVYDSTSGKWVNGDVASDIGDLNDVDITSPSNGQVLSYNSTSQEWVNTTPSAGSSVSVTQVQSTGTKIATVTVDNVDTDLYAPTSRDQVSSGQTVPSDSTGLNNDIYMKFNRASWESDYELISSSHSIDPQRRWTVPNFDTSEYYRVKILGADEQEATKLISEIDNWYPFPETSTMYLQVTADNELVVRTGSHSETVYGVYATKYYENEIAGIDTAYGNLGGSWYEFPKGTEVEANPSGTGSTDLTKIGIDGTIYNIPSGGSGSSTLAGLTDVDLDTPTDGQGLVYDATNQKWVNADVGGGGGGGGYEETVLWDTGGTTSNWNNPIVATLNGNVSDYDEIRVEFTDGDNYTTNIFIPVSEIPNNYSQKLFSNYAYRLGSASVNSDTQITLYTTAGSITFSEIVGIKYGSGGGSTGGGNLYGTTDPTNDLGNNGDVYMQYENDIISDILFSGSSSSSANANPIVITVEEDLTTYDTFYVTYSYSQSHFDGTDTINASDLSGGARIFLPSSPDPSYGAEIQMVDNKLYLYPSTGYTLTVTKIVGETVTEIPNKINNVFGKIGNRWISFPGYSETVLWSGSESISQNASPFSVPNSSYDDISEYDEIQIEYENGNVQSAKRYSVPVELFKTYPNEAVNPEARDALSVQRTCYPKYDTTDNCIKIYCESNYPIYIKKIIGVKHGESSANSSASLYKWFTSNDGTITVRTGSDGVYWFFNGFNTDGGGSTFVTIPSELTQFAPTNTDVQLSEAYTTPGQSTVGWIGFYQGTIRGWNPAKSANLFTTLYGVVKVDGASEQHNGYFSAYKGIPNSGGISYSTAEQVVGTWIDGKPLYQKTWQLAESATVSSNGGVLPSEVSDYLVSVGAFVIKGLAHRITTSYVTVINGGMASIPIIVWAGENTPYYAMSTDTWGDVTVITLQYTKTI